MDTLVFGLRSASVGAGQAPPALSTPRGIRQDIQEDQRSSASTATWLIARGNKVKWRSDVKFIYELMEKLRQKNICMKRSTEEQMEKLCVLWEMEQVVIIWGEILVS